MFVSLLQFIGLSALLPILVSVLISAGQLTQESAWLFLGLAIVSPFVLLGFSFLKDKQKFPSHRGLLIYAWAFWSVFFLFGTIAIPVPDKVPYLMGQILGMLLFMALVIGSMALLAKWFTPIDRPLWKQWIDVCLFILPIPMLVIGNLLYQGGPQMLNPVFISFVLRMLNFAIYGLVIFAMVTFAIYILSQGQGERTLRFSRIMLTAMLWLLCNMLLLFSPYSGKFLEVMFTIMPVFTGNVLVFIVPSIMEGLIIGLAYGVGWLLEKKLDTMFIKRRNQ